MYERSTETRKYPQHIMAGKKPVSGRDDHSKYVHQNKKCSWQFQIRELPWTEKQQKLIRLLQDRDTKCVFIKGPAGTSKSIVAVYVMLKLLLDKKISEVTYVRSAVESASHSLGYLPGDASTKIAVFASPLHDKLEELLDKGTISKLLAEDRVKATVVNYMRGRSLSCQGMIVDEAQNMNFMEILTLVTRMGEFSKILLLGDTSQSDLGRHDQQDFTKFYNMFDNEDARNNGIRVFEFTKDDIVRSEFVRYIVGVLEANNYGRLI